MIFLNSIPIRRRPWRGLPLTLTIGAAGLWLATSAGMAQEAVRLSLAGEAAAQANSQAAATIGYYNLLLGRVASRFGAGLALQYNDNILSQGQNVESDFIFQPGLSTQVHVPLTQQNSVDVSLNAGYSAYVEHPAQNRVFVNPGSGLAFNLYVGDCVINLHDHFSVTENSYQNPGARGTSYSQFQNSAGLNASADLNELIVGGDYEHANYLSLGGNAPQPDGQSENLSANAGLRLRPEFTVGVESGGTLIRYNGGNTATSPNATQWSVGGFTRLLVSQYLNVKLDAGYTVYQPDTSGTNSIAGSSPAYYFDLSVSHQVNRWLGYTLSAGRSTDLGFYGQPYSRYYVRWSPNWNVLHHFSLTTPVWWQKGTQTYNQGNAFDQYGAGFTLGRQLTAKLNGSLSYQFVQETSPQAGNSYVNNIVGLNFTYQF